MTTVFQSLRQYSRTISWWNQDLEERRRKVLRLFNAAKKSGYWTDYKRSLTEYKTGQKTFLEETL
jgi:cyclopropane fatty-acyl-phospholipid synthase-like methyltransferase